MVNLNSNPDFSRLRAFRYGHTAEFFALLCLFLKGYRPIARRYAAHGGEVDIIARKGKTIIFVEVKARQSIEAASRAIDTKKHIRFSRAVRAWLAHNAWATGYSYRADAFLVARWILPHHIPNAFPIIIQ